MFRSQVGGRPGVPSGGFEIIGPGADDRQATHRPHAGQVINRRFNDSRNLLEDGRGFAVPALPAQVRAQGRQ